MKVGLVMGSISDKEIVKKAVDVLKEFGVEYELRVISAHRSLDAAIEFVNAMEKKDIAVIIAFAGKAAHLAGVLAGMSVAAVIGVPIKSSALDGMDALLSTVQMPKGVPVATVAIDGAENAALLAIQMLAIQDKTLKIKLKAYKEKLKQTVAEMDKNINL
ncbi:MAG: 5-(carboxyamino)imidazole ribonucleotide mutase [Treponema lecithinolyticum]|uniref:5-(carboxyamino)imidazole ribonucleotide mutase n=1 Tax=Treponema lecithinolyticum TaxID=53418 RepID=UPI003FA2F989